MKSMKTFGVFILIMSGLMFIAACGSNDSSDNDTEGAESSGDAEYTLRVGITQNDQNAEYEGIEQFKERVEERTDGAIKIETYHSDQLASVPDLIEQASTGNSVGTITDAGQIGDLKNEFYVLQSPYMFQNNEQIDKFLESDLYQEWVDDFSAQGLQILSFNWKLGERNLATTNKIETIEDVKGNVIRTNGSQIVDETISSMGGSPSGMPWTEAYPGLEQGVIDGVEAHNLAIYESSLHEVINHIARTNHFQLVSGLVASADWFNGLPEEFQEIVIEEAQAAGDTAAEIAAEKSAEYEELMIEEGVEFHDVDQEEFRKMTQKAYESVGLEEARKQVNEVIQE
ncbi:C4-dicarboxylate TRAP transporter substrate-binding protein [Alteribacillus sp. HJP-4]|uniref:C4-dicarboxylate TRAP transporter substrate-binding protein n=1 Tax=Alteribacillus sp. HJP-4 TaxID=2775394 RepID=UPI0035CD366C